MFILRVGGSPLNSNDENGNWALLRFAPEDSLACALHLFIHFQDFTRCIAVGFSLLPLNGSDAWCGSVYSAYSNFTLLWQLGEIHLVLANCCPHSANRFFPLNTMRSHKSRTFAQLCVPFFLIHLASVLRCCLFFSVANTLHLYDKCFFLLLYSPTHF